MQYNYNPASQSLSIFGIKCLSIIIWE